MKIGKTRLRKPSESFLNLGTVLAVAATLLLVLSASGWVSADIDVSVPRDRASAAETQEPLTLVDAAQDGAAKEQAAKEQAARDQAAKDQAALVWGPDATPPAAGWSKPALNQRYPDPVYETSVRRVTSADGTRFDRNTYSRRQAENSSGDLFMTYHGEAEYRVYNRRTLELRRVLDIDPNAEPQWHPTQQNIIRHTSGSNSYVGDLRYYQTNVRTGETKVIADLTTQVQEVWPSALYMADRAEGSPSADGSRHAWIVFDAAEEQLGIISHDLERGLLLGAIPLRSNAERLDWVSMSVTGTYVAAGYDDGTYVYDADLSNERQLTTKADHSDLALGVGGEDAYVYIDFSADTDGGWLVSIDLDSLERTRIFDIYEGGNTSIHISGKGYDKPGWVVVSTYNCKVPGAWTCEKVMAVEMAEAGRILNLAHTYNCGDHYWTETHAVVNRSFTRVYFNSDGGSCDIDAEVYQVDLPQWR